MTAFIMMRFGGDWVVELMKGLFREEINWVINQRFRKNKESFGENSHRREEEEVGV